jgi:type VI secretion system protein ImpE
MADADEFLRKGDLKGARHALVEAVKRAPDDQQARMFLFQLFCVLGEWEKAKTQLRTLAQLSPEAQMLAVVYNQTIDAETTRADAFAGKAQPALLVSGSTWAGDLAAALGAFAQGRIDEGVEQRDRAFDACPDTPGEIDGMAFDFIADADGRFGPAFEAVVHGKWGLVPFESVARIKTEGPKDLRDLVWLPVELEFRTGQSAAAMLPARYPGTEASEDAELLLARGTDWRDMPWGQAGVGQRLWTLSGGQDVGLLSFRNLIFA